MKKIVSAQEFYPNVFAELEESVHLVHQFPGSYGRTVSLCLIRNPRLGNFTFGVAFIRDDVFTRSIFKDLDMSQAELMKMKPEVTDWIIEQVIRGTRRTQFQEFKKLLEAHIG